MTDSGAMHHVRELRDRGLSPKEIARSLGMRPAAVSRLTRTLAAERAAARPDADLVDCRLNAGWSTGLSFSGHPEWRDPGADDGVGGLVTALVARRRPHRRDAAVCVYLVDVHCLGVKDAIGPRTVDDRELRELTSRVFGGYPTPPARAPIELVRDLVLGAADYGRGLGFAPHPDFEPARAHLGAWTGPSAITFGCDGKPTYIAGPYDDSDRVLGTLRRTVGRDGFDYTIAVDGDDLRMTA